ncbi:MAG: hypothetical protein KKA19_06275 [Candidatus Margulisbacteria bacterium]|nr:hypothetical protein [Candidatus Margulisiibacteriota bacterium]
MGRKRLTETEKISRKIERLTKEIEELRARLDNQEAGVVAPEEPIVEEA